jgi:ABC-2 type transport system permease protein
MRVLYANIEDVMREAAARWTLLAYFFLSSLFILIFASAVNLDVVDGALAGAKLFGKEVEMGGGQNSIVQLVLGFETVFAVILYMICTFLAVFATAHLVPRMQEKGTVDLYLARPVGRVRLLLSRYVAGLILAGSNVVYLMGSIWLIVAWKTHVMNPRFLFAGLIIFLLIAVLLAFAFMVGVFTSSTAVSIMTTYGLALVGVVLYFAHLNAAAISRQWLANLIEGLYWVVPKTFELGKAVVSFVGGDQLPSQVSKAVTVTPVPLLTTAAFGVGCLILASWLFTRKEF